MIKPLLVITGILWAITALAANVFWATVLAINVFVIGLLVIIALNVQAQREAVAPSARSSFDSDADPDADLFEEFDDPYAEGLVDDASPTTEPASRPDPSIRVNPRRKARSSA
jgi:hypothetical protein